MKRRRKGFSEIVSGADEADTDTTATPRRNAVRGEKLPGALPSSTKRVFVATGFGMNATPRPPTTSHPAIAAFRSVPRTGVIFVTSEAENKGYRPGDDTWCNLGQGQPETGRLDGGPERLTSLAITPDAHEYAPVAGLTDLRAAVADFYNRRFRKGKRSSYSVENVAICGGGRLALARAAVALGEVNLGHFLPDYTAYEELLGVFRLFTAIPILLDRARGYEFTADELRNEISGRGLSALLISNPGNPTGRAIIGDDLSSWVDVCRETDCALLVDEFYSHYIWNDAPSPRLSSAAEFVDDVDRDPVVIIDGLTKNWRYPGLRLSWTVGPRSVIEAVTSAGSFLDGGGSRPAQAAAIPLLEDDVVDRETSTIQSVFGAKRRRMITGLRDMGVKIDLEPQGGFYIWGSLEDMPPSLADGMRFFQRALDEKVITVPGMFFDINPGRRRPGRTTRFEAHMRFSFGPADDKLQLAMSRLSKMVADAKRVAS